MTWKQKSPIIPYSEDDDILTKLAKSRGIKNVDKWLNPPKSYEHNPSLLNNIDKLVQRLIRAIHLDENITIMGDVDADGILSCSIMYNYIIQLSNNVNIIHAQRSMGHGLETVLKENNDAENVKYLDTNTDLLLIVDSSSNSVESCKLAKEKYGVDILIVDHHEIDRKNPYATIVNCQLGNYPNKNLSGTAMCYKVCQVLDEYMAIEMADNYLDLVAIGLVADLMSMEEQENRSLVNRGMRYINNLGLRFLLKKANVDFYHGISTTDIGFKISPLFNACSRFDKLELAIELLTIDDEEKSMELAKQLNKLNNERKKEESKIVDEVIKEVKDDHKVCVIINNDIDSNFRGLICMQLSRKLQKPAFVLSYNEDTKEYHGSARSIGAIPLKNLCTETGQFIYCQGHGKAFGLGIKEENLEKALEMLDDSIQNSLSKEVIYYDLELDASDIDKGLILEVEKFSRITGQQVAVPKFLVTDCSIQDKQMLGKKKKKETVKFNCDNELALMKFKVDELYGEDIEKALEEEFLVEIDVVGTLSLNRFFHFGKKELIETNQIFIEDYELKGEK